MPLPAQSVRSNCDTQAVDCILLASFHSKPPFEQRRFFAAFQGLAASPNLQVIHQRTPYTAVMPPLYLLQIVGLIVQIGQDGCSEADRHDLLTKAWIPLDSLAHTPHLLIGQRLVTVQNDRPGCCHGKIAPDLPEQVQVTHADRGSGLSDNRPVAVWLGGSPSAMGRMPVHIPALKPRHILQPERVQRLRLIIVGPITAEWREGRLDPMRHAFIQMSSVFSEPDRGSKSAGSRPPGTA